MTGALDIGGIVGHNYGGVIDTAENYGKVVGLNTPELNNKQQVGGIAGMNRGNGIINNAYNEGAVEGYVLVGGIVGTNFISGTVSNVVNKGSVSAEKQVGGIAGKNDDIIINAKMMPLLPVRTILVVSLVIMKLIRQEDWKMLIILLMV